ncbi:Transcriptional regulatory protein DegU [Rhizobium rhizogenes]|uniref:Response regulator transcription factor n=2 Tax=Rhizobium/Agrobacterium group TaxID=227290 RepID=A0A546Y2X2_AGRTU|nr:MULTISPECIES: response regulator transcription factor [Rhizobium/Agrobacterium group]MBO0126526.1 response regulator transcription factor [Agrobacterium sp. OT33]AQS64614.1 DNA-binding response regulator [Rhizobium rhizogenes]MCZ7445798.1 response regulator transcription factor [Rhizobium rhizogenes]NSZ81682.1 response regulator transcription factor [Agrobacterium tumefaciens]NTE58770.1 response regulator transcription factor [Agrobacterium tumefaciens]
MTVHPIRVLLIDNHPLVLDGLKAVLETYDHIAVVGTAVSAMAGIDAAVATRPHVVLMDINMPQINGIDALELFKEKRLPTRVLMLSMHDSREYISMSVMYGAAGYILKDVATEEIVAAIDAVAAGGTYFSSGVRDVLMEGSSGRLKALTTREQDVLLLIARGKSNRDAALALDIAERTMETHRKNIKRKLDIATTAGLIRYAIDNGLIKE